MNIVIIGTGNVATVLGKLIVSKGHKVVEVVGRNQHNTSVLAKILNAKGNVNFENISEDGDIYMIAVVDTAIEAVAQKLLLKNKLIVHTAGSVSINVLNKPENKFGVLWPLQTLRKEMQVIPEIPFVIDANNETTYATLLSFTKSITNTVFRANDARRIKLHLAAVVVSNLTNHLYTLADDYCQKETLDFKLLIPLIEETGKRIKTNAPAIVQTGPAARKDDSTINSHMALLKGYPTLQKIYQLISESIKLGSWRK